MTTVRDAQNAVDLVAGILLRWRRTLRQVADGLEAEARYEQDTDEPLNLEARVQSRLLNVVDDEIAPLLENLTAIGQEIEKAANERTD
ncbi:MAG: hypothetical protein AAGE94_01865 [Acidobacteriota bacterium]